jgi:energy-coupling factor transporter ATP-binding protein EcfA2
MLKLKRLRVERFRSLVKGTELSFSDGINIVLGQNGTGKTTLLELISMVVSSDFSSLMKEEFAFEYELSASVGEDIIIIVRNKLIGQTTIELGAREIFESSAEVLGGADRRLLLQYDTERGLTVADGPPQDLENVIFFDVRGFLISFVSRLPTFHQRFSPFLFAAGSAQRLDESLDLFRRIVGPGDPVGNFFVVKKHVWLPNPFVPSLVPRSLVLKLMLLEDPKKPDYSFAHSELDFLDSLKDMMGFKAAALRVDVTEPSGGADKTIKVGNFVFRFWWEDGTFITHERLSYGQKRLLTFFYYLACNSDIVIADELVNGLHHSWITASIEALEQRQAFLTSQNPLLLDYIPITSANEVRRSFVLCRGEPREGRPGWIWENMSEKDAEELFSAYQVGVEHVSEILQSRGLW